MGEETGAGGGVDVATTLGALDGALPAISATADEAR